MPSMMPSHMRRKYKCAYRLQKLVNFFLHFQRAVYQWCFCTCSESTNAHIESKNFLTFLHFQQWKASLIFFKGPLIANPLIFF
jgi:hypothetical protein